MTTYGNLRTANEDKIKLSGGGQLGGEHPVVTDGVHRNHTLGGAIAKPSEKISFRGHKLGGALGNGAVTDTSGTTPMKTSGGKVGGSISGN